METCDHGGEVVVSPSDHEQRMREIEDKLRRAMEKWPTPPFDERWPIPGPYFITGPAHPDTTGAPPFYRQFETTCGSRWDGRTFSG